MGSNPRRARSTPHPGFRNNDCRRRFGTRSNGRRLPTLIIGRVLQGGGTIAFGVTAFATIQASFPKNKTSFAQGVLTATTLLCVGFGPLIGAGLAALGTWRLTIASPLAELALLPAIRSLMRTAPGRTRPFDTRGAIYVAVGIAAATLLAQGRTVGISWAMLVIVAIVLAIATIAVISQVQRHPHGFIPTGFVGERRARVIAGVAATCFGAYLVLAQIVPEQLHNNEGWSKLAIGIALLPSGATAAASGLITGRWIGRKSTFIALTALSGIGALAMVFAAAIPSPSGPIAAAAIGIAGFAGAQVVIADKLPQLVGVSDRGAAIGFGNLVFLSGGTLGTALATSTSHEIGTSEALITLAIVPLVAAMVATRAVSLPNSPGATTGLPS